MMADMQKKMKDQMEQNKNVDKEAAARQQKQLEDFKKKVLAQSSFDKFLYKKTTIHVTDFNISARKNIQICYRLYSGINSIHMHRCL